MKKIYTIVFCLALIFIITPSVFAVEENEAVKKYNITFPVVELGSCTTIANCKTYCEDIVNRDACVTFAKKKGFYQEPQKQNGKKEVLVQNAKTALGCDSEDSCRLVCEKEENFAKCSEFSKKHGFGNNQKNNPGSAPIIQKAKELLGCDSEDSCKAVCQQDANREKCSKFAKQAGIKGGERRIGPGGCDSEDSCRSFCSDTKNLEECSKFGGGRAGNPPANIKGPGGCDSEASCRAYCEKNPEECSKFGGAKEGNKDGSFKRVNREEYEKMCKENPEKCKNPQSIPASGAEEFCKQNPEKCKEKQSIPRIYCVKAPCEITPPQDREDFCKQNPEKCQPQFKQESTKKDDYCREHPQECQNNFREQNYGEQRREEVRRNEEKRIPEFERKDSDRFQEQSRPTQQWPQSSDSKQQLLEQRPRQSEQKPPSEETKPAEQLIQQVRGVMTEQPLLQYVVGLVISVLW